jgi:hypothetical protein
MASHDLAAFIVNLRGRLERGELADLAPIDLGNALTLSNVERAVRRMLSDVEMFRAMDPAERELTHVRARRRALADHLRRLRERLGVLDERP